jgi:hypothetical protein
MFLQDLHTKVSYVEAKRRRRRRRRRIYSYSMIL